MIKLITKNRHRAFGVNRELQQHLFKVCNIADVRKRLQTPQLSVATTHTQLDRIGPQGLTIVETRAFIFAKGGTGYLRLKFRHCKKRSPFVACPFGVLHSWTHSTKCTQDDHRHGLTFTAHASAIREHPPKTV